MLKSILVREYMAANVVTLTPQMDVFDAISLLLKHEISGAPVIDEQRNFLGVFSEKGCMRVIVKAAYEQLPSNKIEPFIDRQAMTTTADTDILTIAQTFHTRGARRLAVV